MLVRTKILLLDQAGTPSRRWASFEDVARYRARERVLWESAPIGALLGGHDRSGVQSRVEIPSIIMVKGLIRAHKELRAVTLTKHTLVQRDRHLCAYCGRRFAEADLRMEHVLPESRGGTRSWRNIVAACEPCNARKANRTPEEAGMALLYLPYTPDRYEGLLLTNRQVLADQMDFLVEHLPQRSRLLI